jgi:hypothetical protein
VRDFVEIADNQWDFNTPDGIPGFGELGAAEEATTLVARAASTTAENTAATLASLQPSGDRPDRQGMTGMSLEDSRVIDPVWQAGAGEAAVRGVEQPVEQTSVESPDKEREPEMLTTSGRLHGSALPK